MSSKLSLSIAAALVLSAAAGGAARAATLGDAESGNPNSITYPNRPISKHSATKDEFNADEIGSPYSVNYRNRPITSDHNWKAEWNYLESGNPHSVQSGNGAALEGQAEAAAPSAQ
jgi:shikimate 5-dehydrogenase